ncbi:membrane protein [Serratia nematodiphila DZ0503SBS1]|nr:membrane protein [Serratia nematodiphila DZ0503SBS1]
MLELLKSLLFAVVMVPVVMALIIDRCTATYV